MKRFFALFLIQALLATGSQAVSYRDITGSVNNNTDKEVTTEIMPLVPSLGDLNKELEDMEIIIDEDEKTIQFVEVGEDQSVTVETQDLENRNAYTQEVNTYRPTPREEIIEEVPGKKVIQNYARLYGSRYYSPLNSKARIHDWKELSGTEQRTFYSDLQRSDRVVAAYGKHNLLRYHPLMRRSRLEVAGVYEYNAQLLHQEQN